MKLLFSFDAYMLTQQDFSNVEV